LIGVFASEEDAKSARVIIQDQSSFRGLPEGLSIDEAVLGQMSWTEGYGTPQSGEESEWVELCNFGFRPIPDISPP